MLNEYIYTLCFLIQYFALSESGESMELLLQPGLSEKLPLLFYGRGGTTFPSFLRGSSKAALAVPSLNIL